MKQRKGLGIILLLLTASIWGFGFIGVQTALDNNWSTMGIISFRGIIGGLICLLFSFKEKWWKHKKFILYSVIAGAITFVGYIVQTEGQKLTSTADASFYISFEVLLVPFVTLLLFRKKFGLQTIIASILALIGLLIFSYRKGEMDLFNIGNLYNFLSALCFAVQISFVARLADYQSPFALSAIELLTIGILGSLFIPFTGGLTNYGDMKIGLLGALYVAIFSSCLSFILQNIGQKHVNPSAAAILLSTESIFGIAFSIIFYNVTVTWQMVVGTIILFIAVVISVVDFKDFLTRFKVKTNK